MTQPDSARSNDSIDFNTEFSERSAKIESLGNLYEATQERIKRSLDLIKQADDIKTKQSGKSDDEA